MGKQYQDKQYQGKQYQGKQYQGKQYQGKQYQSKQHQGMVSVRCCLLVGVDGAMCAGARVCSTGPPPAHRSFACRCQGRAPSASWWDPGD